MVLAETGLEKIPDEFINDARTARSCASIGRDKRECLLDRSLHHWMLKGLVDGEKRGRPDIAYHVLLDVTDSLLYKNGHLNLFIHTYDNNVIKIGSELRPPRSYFRFEGLMIDLFRRRRIEAGGRTLMEISKMGLDELLKKIGKPAIGLSSSGKPVKIEALAGRIALTGSTFVIGGFPKGEFSDQAIKAFNEIISINQKGLEATNVATRLIYEMEKVEGMWN
jgi:rRNA small subunit pseudouridine methyltransferase Nep1